MGITIHFAICVAEQTGIDTILDVATTFADARGWRHQRFDDDDIQRTRYQDGDSWEYIGPVRGVAIQTHERCDTVLLEFGDDLRSQGFVKTAFAGVQAHREVVALFRALEPHCDELEIHDEAEYWETNDVGKLARRFG